MSKINILSEQTYNQIAAGEVIDRPYSVVKELVENSIDAGANEITVFVEQGGKGLIRVVDNGGGIEYDDLYAAYLPHATSKIMTAKDLETVSTLGFRGEAIASIAAVSQINIKSRVKDKPCYSLSNNGGKVGEIEESAGEIGTEITVKNLFFNIPVRLGFLKSDRTEETDITNFIMRFILAKPEISFNYYLNNKLIIRSYGTNDEEAMICVYGPSILENCYKLNAEKNGVKISGYIGNQNFFKPNRSYQSIFLNDRYIVNQTIASAISNAYSAYAMKRQYPFYVLHITIPPEVVDVNVHPNKADVRFADNQTVYGIIYSVVSSVLDGKSSALEYVVMPEKHPVIKSSVSPETNLFKDDKKNELNSNDIKTEEKPTTENKLHCASFSFEDAKKEFESEQKNYAKEVPFEVEEVKPPEEFKSEEKNKDDFSFLLKKINVNTDAVFDGVLPPEWEEKNKSEVVEVVDVKEKDGESIFKENKKIIENYVREKSEQTKINTNAFSYKGNLFNTYLIYESEDCAYIIDQHAAHERLIYDRLKKQIEIRSVIQQPLLLPYVLETNTAESNFLSEQLENLQEIGFEIESFGLNSFKISAVPLDLQTIDFKEFFDDVLSDINGLKGIKLTALLKDKLATKACKAAVKGGMSLSKEEIDALFRMIDENFGLKCPHGRPVVVKLTKYEIEKMFKRIV